MVAPRASIHSCPDITSLIVRDLVTKDQNILSYSDDFSSVAGLEQHAWQHLDLARLGLQEAAHKVCPPACIMTWLGLQFNTSNISVTVRTS